MIETNLDITGVNVASDDEIDELVEACERFFSAKGPTVWGCAFDLTDPESRQQAAEWLADHIVGVYEHSE